MLKNKLNLASLCVAFCFFSCGDTGSPKSRVEQLLAEIKNKKESYTKDTIYAAFRKNTNLDFELKIEQEKERNRQAFTSRKDSKKEQQTWENEMKYIDYLPEYVEAAFSNKTDIPEDQIPASPSDISSFLTKDIYSDASQSSLKPEVLTNLVGFVLTTRAIELMVLYPTQFEQIKNALYETYDDVFYKVTGLKISFRNMCYSQNANSTDVVFAKIGYKSFKMLSGFCLFAIERYGFYGKKVSSEEDADLSKICHDNLWGGSSKVLMDNTAYTLFLNSVKTSAKECCTIIQNHLKPFIIITDKFDITNTKVTIADMKALMNIEKKLINLSEVFEQRDEKIFIKKDNNPNIICTNSTSASFVQTPEMKTHAALIKRFIGKDFIQLLNDELNKAGKLQKKQPDTTIYNVPITPCKIS